MFHQVKANTEKKSTDSLSQSDDKASSVEPVNENQFLQVCPSKLTFVFI